MSPLVKRLLQSYIEKKLENHCNIEKEKKTKTNYSLQIE